jgi:dihydrodipicolinate reductase
MSLMNIIILGFGKVGSEIQKICQKNQIPIKAIVSPNNRIATHKNIADVEIKKGDTVIDFSHPDAVIQNTKTVAASGANIVVGTTGWGKNRESILNIISNSDIGFAYTPNYLPEVHTFWSTIRFLVEEMEAGNNNYSAKIFEIRLATKMVELRGFEPLTPCVQSRCSSQLSYSPPFSLTVDRHKKTVCRF